MKVNIGYTPPVKWELQGSNNEDGEWTVISSPEPTNEFCSNNSGTNPNQCGDTRTNLYPCINTNNTFRYIRIIILLDRYGHFFGSTRNYMRFSGFDIFGFLQGFFNCHPSQFYINISLFPLQLLCFLFFYN